MIKMIKMRGKFGFTILEVVVALSIGLVSLSAGGVLTGLGYKYLDHSLALATVQRDSRIAMIRMAKEFRESRASMVTIGTGASSISFPSARDASRAFQFTSTGAPSWQKVVVYYWDSNTKKLYRYEESKTNWTSSYNPDSAIGNANAKEVIPNITSLQFAISLDLVTITLTVAKDTRVGQVKETLSTNAQLHN